MRILVIGDVHGCYYTLKELVETYWDPEQDYLIQLGDLINKGPHSALCVRYWLRLEEKYPYQVFLLRGNHEQMYINGSSRKVKPAMVNRLNKGFKSLKLDPKKVLNWLSKKPLKWETPNVLISHAGVNKFVRQPFSHTNNRGVLYNRSPLKDIGKLQVIGHAVVKGNKPVFSTKENAWRIDTGAVSKGFLSAVRLSYDVKQVEVVRIERSEQDVVSSPVSII